VHVGRRMVRSAVHNAFLNILTIGTAFPHVPPRNDPCFATCCVALQHTAVSASGQCHEVYATVKERATGRIDTICASRVRFSDVYRCRDTPLEIRTLPGSGMRTRYFLLKYQGNAAVRKGFGVILSLNCER